MGDPGDQNPLSFEEAIGVEQITDPSSSENSFIDPLSGSEIPNLNIEPPGTEVPEHSDQPFSPFQTPSHAPINVFSSGTKPESTRSIDESPSTDNSTVQYGYNPALSEKYQFSEIDSTSDNSVHEDDQSVEEGIISDAGKLTQEEELWEKPEKESDGISFFTWLGNLIRYFIRKLIFASFIWAAVLAFFVYEKEILEFAIIELDSYEQGRGILWSKRPPPKPAPIKHQKTEQRPSEENLEPQDKEALVTTKVVVDTAKDQVESKPIEVVVPKEEVPASTAKPAITNLRLVDRKPQEEKTVVDGFTRHTYSNGDKFIGTFQGGKKNGEGTMFFTNGEVYVGQWDKDLFHGQGTYTWPNGDRFVGMYADGKRNGNGVFTWSNSQYFEGQYKNGRRWGKGKMIFANGEVYEGEFLEDQFHGGGTYSFSDGSTYDGLFEYGVIQGEGKYVYSNGRVYEGLFLDGKRSGQGRMAFPNGEFYDGSWENDEYHGMGHYRWSSGDWYRGHWVHGKMEGLGTYHWANGDEYKGQFQMDKPHGDGILKYLDTGYYEGTFAAGLRDGEGTYYSPDGYSYSGTWKNGERHGLGATKWPDGEGYHGQWQFGVEHGMGRYSWSAGAKYIGQWSNGAKNGLGTFVTADGQIREGLWKDDSFVGVIPENIEDWKKELKFMKFFFERSTGNKTKPSDS